MATITYRRLVSGERDAARTLFTVIASVFEEPYEALSDDYIDRLLRREDFWPLAAFAGDEIIGGLTAHTLPMTRSASSELFIFDIAVQPLYQRRGVGRGLVAALRSSAAAQGIRVLFVPADNEDTHALDFYHALGGEATLVTIFTFT